MSKEGREIAQYFGGKCGFKFTQKLFLPQIKIADSLLNAGYTEKEIKDIIDYLIEYPPREGFKSLAYIQYVGNEILQKIKVKKMNEIQFFFEEQAEEETGDNKEKFEKNNKNMIKGMVKF